MSATEPATEQYDPYEAFGDLAGDVRDPWPDLAAARRLAPVQKTSIFALEGVEAPPDLPDEYTVYSYDLVSQVLRDNHTFSSEVYAAMMGPVMGHTILEMDEPEHRRHRSLVAEAFRQKTLARWESELVSAVVDELIDSLVGGGGGMASAAGSGGMASAAGSGGRAELVRQFTFPFPVQVIARILGLPRRDYPRFQRWSLELISVGTDWDRGIAASEKLRDYFKQIVDLRRAEPADDLISDLAHAEIDGHTLSDEEIFAFLRLLLPAGVETTYRSSGNLLFGLLTHPDQLDAVRADRALLPQAIEEGLRWEPPLHGIARVATVDTELGGEAIKAGAVLSVAIGAANRDETRYPDPDRFDIFRDPQQHIAFGFGPHMCLGMHLARMETRVAVDALIDRLPGLRLDPDGDDPHIRGQIFRSPTALPVLFG
jgi:cytochrome P450